jgi:Flp pilus assembly protein TadB
MSVQNTHPGAPISYSHVTRAAWHAYLPTWRGVLRWSEQHQEVNAWARAGIVAVVWFIAAGLACILAVVIVALWAGVTLWYILIFGVFGLFVIPFRLIRRGQRGRR